MGLFSKSQIDSINAIAQKSKSIQAPQSTKKISSINDELINSSKAVEEYFKDSPAILITSKQQLHEYVTAALDGSYIGIDTETTGLDRTKDYIVGASLYYPGGVECYIPMKHRIPIFEDPYKNQLSYEDVAEEFQRFVDNDSKLIFANANFDLYMIWKDLKVNLCPVCYYDVILAWRCLKEDELHNGLKELYNKYVLKGEGDPKRFSDFFSPQLFPYCKPEIARLYAANDAKITYDLFKWQLPFTVKSSKQCQKNHLEHIADLIWKVEFPLISVIQEIERTGMYIDQDLSKVLQSKYHSIYDREMKNLKDMVQAALNGADLPMSSKKPPFTSGQDFNPRSPLHVKYLCYEVLKLPKPDGKESTGVGVLAEFNLPITDKIVEVRSLATNISTFVDKLPDAVSADGKIHADFKQIGAACVTGDTYIATPQGFSLISKICRDAKMHPGEFIELQDVQVINRYGDIETADYGIYYESQPTIKLSLEDSYTLQGTYNHPIIVYTTQNDVNEEFVELCNVKIGDLVKVVDQIHPFTFSWRKVVKLSAAVSDVYDLHVPGSHSFISNCMISHNTGRMSSASPNLQNIPSKLDDIRHMFRASPAEYMEKDLNVYDDCFEIKLSKFYQVQLADGRYLAIDKLGLNQQIVINHEDTNYLVYVVSIDINGSEAILKLGKPQ